MCYPPTPVMAKINIFVAWYTHGIINHLRHSVLIRPRCQESPSHGANFEKRFNFVLMFDAIIFVMVSWSYIQVTSSEINALHFGADGEQVLCPSLSASILLMITKGHKYPPWLRQQPTQCCYFLKRFMLYALKDWQISVTYYFIIPQAFCVPCRDLSGPYIGLRLFVDISVTF